MKQLKTETPPWPWEVTVLQRSGIKITTRAPEAPCGFLRFMQRLFCGITWRRVKL